MNDIPNTSSLANERKNTDASLNAERDKATQTLSTANTKTQSQTDKIVDDERAIADQKTVASRMAHDQSRPSARSDKASVASENQLKEERRKTMSLRIQKEFASMRLFKLNAT